MVQSPNEVRFDPEGTYLLVGGLGGIGCSLGVWMAEKGAKHLTFMTRSGAHTAEAKRTLKDIASLGCGVDVLRCDVGDFDQVERAIASFTRPLRGIIHGAMALKVKTPYKHRLKVDYALILIRDRTLSLKTWNIATSSYHCGQKSMDY